MTVEELDAMLKTIGCTLTDVGYTVTIMVANDRKITCQLVANGSSIEEAFDKCLLDALYRHRMGWQI